MSLVTRFMAKVQIVPGRCWKWNGAKCRSYGRIYNGTNASGNPQAIQAQRAAWLIFRGKIPRGMFVCHHCDNPECTNPEHLFLGTNRDNVNDMVAKGRATQGAHNRDRTHCVHGHPFSGSNLYIHDGSRRCRTCVRIRMAKHRAKKKESKK